jgi:hypothetical protein
MMHDKEKCMHQSDMPLMWDQFSPIPIETDINQAYAIRADWLRRLVVLRCSPEGHRPASDDIRRFTEHLVQQQRTEFGIGRFAGSWTLFRDTGMPSDARVNFAYVPTYIALSWLLLVRARHPEIAAQVRGIDGAVILGVRFSTGRMFRGHGYDANADYITATSILAAGLVTGDQDDAINRLGLMRALRNTLYEIQISRNRASDWSRVPEADLAAASQILDIMNPVDDELICRFLKSRASSLVPDSMRTLVS